MSTQSIDIITVCHNYGEKNRDDSAHCQRCGAELQRSSSFSLNYPPKILLQYVELGIGIFLVIEACWILVDLGLTVF